MFGEGRHPVCVCKSQQNVCEVQPLPFSLSSSFSHTEACENVQACSDVHAASSKWCYNGRHGMVAGSKSPPILFPDRVQPLLLSHCSVFIEIESSHGAMNPKMEKLKMERRPGNQRGRVNVGNGGTRHTRGQIIRGFHHQPSPVLPGAKSQRVTRGGGKGVGVGENGRKFSPEMSGGWWWQVFRTEAVPSLPVHAPCLPALPPRNSPSQIHPTPKCPSSTPPPPPVRPPPLPQHERMVSHV